MGVSRLKTIVDLPDFSLPPSSFLLGWLGPHHSERKLHGATSCPSSLFNRCVRPGPPEPHPIQEHGGQQQCWGQLETHIGAYIQYTDVQCFLCRKLSS